VPSYALSKAADADLEQIARHSIEQWGFARAETYLMTLHQAFDHLATYPDLGRSIDDIRQGYLRFENESHAVFYRKEAPGILIVRVLHQRMQPEQHLPS